VCVILIQTEGITHMANPYDDKDYSALYENRYNESLWSGDTIFELRTIEKHNGKLWCDVACGTGYHLSHAIGNFERTGIDLSETMTSYCKDNRVSMINGDVLTWDTTDRFDLVTNFWLGYSHQKSLYRVLKFFDKMIDITKTGGNIIVAIFNGDGKFFNIPYRHTAGAGGDFKFESVQWSYTEHDRPELSYTCICPHPELVLEKFIPHFENYKIFNRTNSEYGVKSDGTGSGKELMIFENKIG